MAVPGILNPNASVMLLGQAPGATEVRRGVPFCGPAGHELDKWLVHAGLAQVREGEGGRKWVDRGHLAITNVFDEELPAGGLAAMTATRKEAKEEGWEPTTSAIVRGRYLRPQYVGCLARLDSEIATVRPNIIVAFGNEALWALNGHLGIESWRGTLFMSRFGPKAIATFHPASILRGGYRNRPLAIIDLVKAAGQSATSTLDLPRRELWLNPTLEDMEHFKIQHLSNALWIAIDIETSKGEITSIAFAPSPRLGICVPFVVDGRSYWPTTSDEVAAWQWVKAICASTTPKILQNGLYDLQWLWVKRGIPVRNYLHDTRLMHHALFPELPKSLGFMGTLWENEQAWKQWSQRHSEKRDDA